jgi:hypothetical protein
VALDPPLRTVGRVVALDPPLRTVGRVVAPDPPLRTVGLVVTLDRPPAPVDDVAPPPPGFLTFADGRVITVPRVGGVFVPDPVVGRGWTTGRPVPPEAGGVTMGRPGDVGEVTPDRPGSVRVTAGGVEVVPVPRPGTRADGGEVGETTPLPEPVGRRTAPPFTPGRAEPGALPPDRFGGGLTVLLPPEASFPWVRRTAVPATPGTPDPRSRTTTCGVQGSPSALSLKPKWATPRLGWTYTTRVPRYRVTG